MKKLFFVLMIAALACALPAAADSVTLAAVSGNSQGGVSTAPYYLSVNGGADISVMCIDFTHHVTVGESWQANLNNLSAGDLSETRLDSYNTYREMAWLYDQFVKGAGPSGDINYAVWALSSASAMSSPGWTAGAQHWYDLATTTDLANFSTVNFTIITPKDMTGVDTPQEFITETPEPAGLVLVGSGLLGLAGYGKKKFRKVS